MIKTLYIMCGPAGSGKSTWAADHAWPGSSAIISRDNIRFSMVKENEKYFSKEKEVKQEFYRQIKEALELPWVVEVYADATHLTAKSRAELIKNTCQGKDNVKVIPVVIVPPLEICLKQNSNRTGRRLVPETVIRNMYDSFENPNFDCLIPDFPVEYLEVRD